MNASRSRPDTHKPVIRVLLVDDSRLAIEIIRRMLDTEPTIEIVGAASNGLEALKLIPRVQPHVICTDLHMPDMDGMSLTREIMAHHPLPILVLSNSLQPDQTDNIFAALQAGAVDVLAKPAGGLNADFGIMAHDLIMKIKVLAGVKVIRRRPARSPSPSALTAAEDGTRIPAAGMVRADAPRGGNRRTRIVGIGASTGGPQAIESLLAVLPGDFPLSIICVQHISPGFMDGLVYWLAKSCRIRVQTAIEGERPRPGTAYFPPDSRHLEINPDGRFHCSSALPLDGHRPSVDLTFSALARTYGQGALGILLTGMGQDGANGLLDIRRAGGTTFAQNEQSSVVFGMPKVAIDLGAAERVLALEEIAAQLLDLATPPDRKGHT